MMNALRRTAVLLSLTVAGTAALGQSAIERHVWQEARSFEPYSRTASAITGTITLSGNPDLATPGSMMALRFGNGAEVNLTSEGAYWRPWSYGSDAKQTAEVFRLSDNPGELLNGNTICGGPPSNLPIYFVFFEDRTMGPPPLLQLTVFKSEEAPFDITSEGLCATFVYDIEAGA